MQILVRKNVDTTYDYSKPDRDTITFELNDDVIPVGEEKTIYEIGDHVELHPTSEAAPANSVKLCAVSNGGGKE